jgi:hypothetical protein
MKAKPDRKKKRIIVDLTETRRKRRLRCEILAHGLAHALKDCWDAESLIDLTGTFEELRTEAELLLNAQNTLRKLLPRTSGYVRRRRNP